MIHKGFQIPYRTFNFSCLKRWWWGWAVHKGFQILYLTFDWFSVRSDVPVVVVSFAMVVARGSS